MGEPIYIKTTMDGRKVEVIDGWVCLDGQPEADAVVDVNEHPNRQAIQRAVPGASHVAGRLPLTLMEAGTVRSAMAASRPPIDTSPRAVAERLRKAVWAKTFADGVE